jgi:hypothetical protein
MSELTELEVLAKILISRVTEQVGDPKLNASKLLSALAELTVHDVSEPDIGWDKAKYHSTRLAIELGKGKNDTDKDRRYVNRIWKDLVEAYEVVEPSIENDIRKQGYRKILKPKKTDPKTGRVEFYLDMQEIISEEEIERVECDKKNIGVISYHLAKLPKPNFIAKRFQKMTLENKKLWFYFAIPSVPVLVMLAWFEYLIFTNSYAHLTWFILTIIMLLSAWFVIHPFYSLLDRRISIAPFWMLRLRTRSAQIEMRLTKNIGPLDRPVKELVFVVYEGECPICGGEVDIIQGKKQHKDRLIGQCMNNGVEHIFSFDQVTKKGVPLRNDIYKG